ncbi:MAG: DUF883 family protein [Burkholderiales bacterium]|jgi:ElaB/YqjD/DUF883 family membrane-anchored ribosome-binding protein|nr:DUF883 family protein [Burkholderiales bacterium]
MSRPFPSEKLADDFSTVLSEAESLLNDAAAETGEKARDLRRQVEAKLTTAKLRMQEVEEQLADRARICARATDDFVHDHPWQAVGVGAAIGLVLGLLISRR